MNNDIKRIQKMEAILNECHDAINCLEEQLNQMENIKEKMCQLFKYYGGEQWYSDREMDIPTDIAAGVLSEDLVYNEIIHVREIAFQMIEQACDILKNRI